MEDFFVAQKQDLIYISLGCLFVLLVGSFFIYKVEIQKAYRSLGAYRVLVSMLLFFVVPSIVPIFISFSVASSSCLYP